MPFTNNSPNMLLPIPEVGLDPGPQYATDVNNCLTIVDGHNHSPGYGVQVNPTGIDINSDLPFNDNNLTSARSLRLQPQSTVLSGASDLGCLYEVVNDLFYNDGQGNQIRITQSGGIAGTPGSIANLVSPASASYVALSKTFVFQSAANTPANMDIASLVLRNLIANSHALTLNPPSAMGADYSLTLPSLPGSTSFLTIDTAGNISGSTPVANGITFSMLSTALQNDIVYSHPTKTILTSGSGTYTLPAGVSHINVTLVGAGGGGGGGGISGGNTGIGGGTTTFGSAFLSGGGGNAGGSPGGGSGGAASLAAGASGIALSGGSGGGACVVSGKSSGGGGASSPLGGAGGAGSGSPSTGRDAIANTGSGGGGGGGGNSSTSTGGGGGAAGGYVMVTITAPLATYAYTIGSGGAGGAAGDGSSSAGGAGADGIIIIDEFYSP